MAPSRMAAIRLPGGRWRKRQEEEMVFALEKGLVAAYPTDTIYGLGCRAGDKKAVQRIAAIKGRPAGKGFVLLASSLGMVERYCLLGDDLKERLKNLWPGRVTAVLPARKKSALAFLRKDGTLAFRVPASASLRRIISRLGEPLVSTSLNRSGMQPLGSPREIPANFYVWPDIAFDAGPLSRKKPSKLIVFERGKARRVR